jgi:hypothetical protein
MNKGDNNLHYFLLVIIAMIIFEKSIFPIKLEG